MEKEPLPVPPAFYPMGLEVRGTHLWLLCQVTPGCRDTSTSPKGVTHTVGASLLRDGDVLLEEAMEVGLRGMASFLPRGTFSTPFSRDE